MVVCVGAHGFRCLCFSCWFSPEMQICIELMQFVFRLLLMPVMQNDTVRRSILFMFVFLVRFYPQSFPEFYLSYVTI